MPAALSPSGRVRSRTSDISDFLRGRHDHKTSTDLQSPPPLPHFTDPVTPSKQKSKFAFLARKRKSSFTPTNPGASAAIAAAATATIAASAGTPRAPFPSSSQSSPAGPSVRNQSRDLPPLPPLSIIAPGYRHPNSDPSRRNPASPPPGSQIPQYAPQSGFVPNARKQKGSFESTRHSTDSRSSLRPIITVSPPHNTMHEGEDAYTSPRTPPQPSGPPSPLRNSDTSLPTPTPSDGTADSPTSADIPTPSTSTHSLANLSGVSAYDGPLTMATSYKEETLLRKDHFDIGESDMHPRRGTVSVNKSQPLPATVGFSPSRQDRRHISVMQLNRLKKEIVATTPPRIRKVPSASSSLAVQNGRQSVSSLTRSNSASSSPSQTQVSPQGSRSPTPQGRKIPPPLKRTWHTAPITGPPKEPLPSPPTSTSHTLPTPTTADSVRTGRSPSSSPISMRRTLPPLSTREISPSCGQGGAKSPDSLTSFSIPSSPARSEAEAPSLRTPIREDPTQRILADENATSEQLREALRKQSEKYSRLSAYLLNLTERHALEKAELIRKIETLEQNAARCEREMKGLKWLLANTTKHGPARADSNTLPGKKVPRDRSASTATTRSAVGSVRSAASVGSEGRMSFDSPAGSVEEGLVELQTTISEFIAPLGSLASDGEQLDRPSIRESVGPSASPSGSSGVAGRTRTRRSNTVPNGLNGIPQLPNTSQALLASSKQKQARRTSSPQISSPSMSAAPSPSKRTGVPAYSPGNAGLGLGLGLGRGAVLARDGSTSPPSISRSSTPDRHARCDSSILSSLPSLSTLSSAASGLSSIPETPRTDVEALPALDEEGASKRRFAIGAMGSMIPSPSSSPNSRSNRLSASSASSSGSAGSSRVSTSPSIGQVLDRSRRASHQQPEMDTILRRLRAFGHGSRSS
ncbi:hypothetical protein C8Q80DRAFT_1267227 [Daedaleopsis nitida]|nr:hypothetical protein C8Q80DRAFT_1267227 [Daedaleopsis nitida]